MAWTAPRTWTTGELVTAAHMNTHVRDNLSFLRGAHVCRAYRSAALTINNGVNTVVSFDAETQDTDNFHSTGTNPTRFTIPAGLDGYYDIHAMFLLATAVSSRIARIKKGGVTTLGEPQEANTFGADAATNEYLTAGEYVELEVFQNSGGNLAAVVGRASLYFEIELRGN